MVDVTHVLYNFCSHQIDINIGDLTSSIPYIFSYFDNTTQLKFSLNRSGIASNYSIVRKKTLQGNLQAKFN